VSSPNESTFVARVCELAPGRSKKFLLKRGTLEIEAFVVNHAGDLHAYVNRCCHVPMTMDWIDNQFFTDDGRYIQCATHGAWYEPDSGECVAGPPVGKCLTRVPLMVRDGEVYAEWPTDEQ
jgi:nitrite reductase/ring-hydroxylating ferredoxin subunit